jgi:hypothetical protein
MAVRCITLRFANASVGYSTVEQEGSIARTDATSHTGDIIAGQSMSDENGNNTPHQAVIICCVLNIGLYGSRRS